jgi:hypothetical protein
MIDYNSISIPEEKLTTMHAHTANSKLKRLMFAVSLYPDWKMASIFANISRYINFLKYWLGDTLTAELQADVKERRKLFIEVSDIYNIIENSYNKYQEGHDYLNPFAHEDEWIITMDEQVPPLMSQEEMLDLVGVRPEWTYDYILEHVDNLIEIERIRRNDAFVESGRYWIVAYRYVLIGKRHRPFVLLAKICETDDTILAIQGVWPLSFMKIAIERMISIPYLATLEDLRFIRIETEITKAGPFRAKYISIGPCE